MEIFPVWRDLFFEYQGDVLEYRITIKDGDEIFHGRAVKSPKDRVIRIRLNDCCESYLNSLLGEEAFREAESIDRVFPLDAYGEFALDIIDGDSWETAYEWAFTNDYSYDYKEPQGSYSEPINGHSATGQLLPYSHLVTGNTESVCYDGCGGIYFNVTLSFPESLSYTGGSWIIVFDTNLDSVYYVCSDGTTGTTGSRLVSFTLPQNNTSFPKEYTCRFYDRQGGTLLGVANTSVQTNHEPQNPDSVSLTILDYPREIPHEWTTIPISYSLNQSWPMSFSLYSSSTPDSGWHQIGGADSMSGKAGRNTYVVDVSPNITETPVYYRVLVHTQYPADVGEYIVVKQLGVNDTSELYLTFEILSAGTINWSGSTYGSVPDEDIEYTLDRGGTWIPLPINTSFSVNAGDIVMFRGTGRNNRSAGSWFGSGTTAYYNVYGNIMSIAYGDSFVGQTENPKRAAFAELFAGTNVVSAADLVLPATDIHLECYENMFYECTSLVSAPSVLPATTLTNSCYRCMFYGCTSLVNAPVILATGLQVRCCEMMFKGCTSLVNAPALPATDMQYGDHCYEEMFYGCTSLVNAPELLGTQNLQQYCYTFMFAECSSLSYLKCLAPRAGGSSTTTQDWLKDVSPTGTFVKAPDAVWPTGRYGVPSGWTVVDAD